MMDVLKSLIEERKNLSKELKDSVRSNLSNVDSKQKKYIRRGDLDQALEEKFRRNQELEFRKKRKSMESKLALEERKESIEVDGSKKLKANLDTKKKESQDKMDSKLTTPGIQIPIMEIKRKLRSLGKPITLFGESAEDRQRRLIEAQHESISNHQDLSIASDYAVRSSYRENDSRSPTSGNNGNADEEKEEEEEEEGLSGAEDENERPADDNKYVYRFFKRMLKLWERDLSARPETIKRTAQGKVATKTMKQCKDYIRPLFKQCKSRDVPDDILKKLTDIVRFCEGKDFVRANDAYISVAIGNAAWPIGVTMVGIHERTGREKINSSKVAHVMNNEAQRKYLTSVKRLITYCQSISNAPPSKKVS